MNGKKLKHILVEKDVQQKELAEAAGVSEPYISAVINGYKVPSVAVLKAIADRLEIKVDELL